MSVFRTAITFFKTWFLPQPAHDDEPVTRPVKTQMKLEPTVADANAQEPSAPAESTVHASYAIPPIPGAAMAAEPAQEQAKKPAPDEMRAAKPNFAHMVKPPEAAGMRHSRRRMEGADPGALE